MNKRNHILGVVLGLFATAAFAGDPPTRTDRFSQELPMDSGGSFVLENPTGSIDIVGTDAPVLSISGVRTIVAGDPASLVIGMEQTRIVFDGNEKLRVVKTVVPAIRPGKWQSSVDMIVRLPRTAHVKVLTGTSARLRIARIAGNVTVRNFTGLILFENVTGSSIIDTVNANVIYDYGQKPSANAQISSVNGDVEVRVPADSNFSWLADTISGDFLTTMPVRGGFTGSAFHASVNSLGGPTLATISLTGHVFLLRKGTAPTEARSVQRASSRDIAPIPGAATQWDTRFRKDKFEGNLTMRVPIGSFEVGEVKGSVKIVTGAGEVKLGAVYGEAAVHTMGGPLDLGDIYRALIAHTDAGDILVRAARDGGNISTGGGNVRLLYTGGATTLNSGGGDITVRQAAGQIDARTISGDVTITVDPNAKTQRIDAKTDQGNITLNVNPSFGAEVEIIILTSDPDEKTIRSDFPGLTIRREEQSGGKTRVHATGKINGGGDRVTLVATEGNVTITSQASNPITVVAP
jgi:DUF4097 and DUF4098 domain-containing protein YvlB